MSINNQQAANLLCSAFEGGSNYWYEIIHKVKPTIEAKPWGDEYTPFYISIPFSTDGKLLIQDNENEDGEIHTLDIAAILKGKKLLAEDKKYSHHYCDVVNENDDAETGDVFLQLCLFGEVIYG